MAEIRLEIEGMHCGACVRRVGEALKSVAGVKIAEVKVGEARLEAGDAQAAIEALAKAGYTARVAG